MKCLRSRIPQAYVTIRFMDLSENRGIFTFLSVPRVQVLLKPADHSQEAFPVDSAGALLINPSCRDETFACIFFTYVMQTKILKYTVINNWISWDSYIVSEWERNNPEPLPKPLSPLKPLIVFSKRKCCFHLLPNHFLQLFVQTASQHGRNPIRQCEGVLLCFQPEWNQ